MSCFQDLALYHINVFVCLFVYFSCVCVQCTCTDFSVHMVHLHAVKKTLHIQDQQKPAIYHQAF